MEIVLTIAGSDTGAGAGIQQDLKTITNCGCYATTVITAITAQNTMGVQHVMPVDAEVVRKQIRSVLDDFDVKAVKIGMIPNATIAEVIIEELTNAFCSEAANVGRGFPSRKSEFKSLPIVIDPIMFSTSGTRLMSDDCIDVVVNRLFPLATLVTPNLPESEYLIKNTPFSTLSVSVLTKGGHADGDAMTDKLWIADEEREVIFTSKRIETTNLHGTGCTLSSAIASYLAKGHDLESAVGKAKDYIQRAIEGGKNLNIGHGNGPLWVK